MIRQALVDKDATISVRTFSRASGAAATQSFTWMRTGSLVEVRFAQMMEEDKDKDPNNTVVFNCHRYCCLKTISYGDGCNF